LIVIQAGTYLREEQLLKYDAKDCYTDFTKDFPNLLDRLPQLQIALYLGVNPSSLNRIIKALAETTEEEI